MKIAPSVKKCDRMIVFITVLGSLKEHFPSKLELPLQEKTTLKAALLEFAEKYRGKTLLFDADENIRRHLVILVNKKRADASAANAELKNGDEVVLYPPVSGG